MALWLGCGLLGLAVGGDPVCTVAPLHGAPAFFIDGRPSSGICYSSYDARDVEMGRRAAQFRACGCRIYNFVVEVSGYGYSPPMWTGPETWDFTELDRRAHTVLQNAPDAYLLPRIYLDSPAWWRDRNPAEMMLLSNGSASFGEKHFALQREGDYPSLASEKWREAMDGALRTVMAHVAASDYADRIVGYQLSGQKTEEWYHWGMNCPLLGDYSEHARVAFKQWLRRRYRDDVALRRAWHRPEVTLGTAEIPSQEARFGDAARTFRDPATEQPVIDFHRFWQDLMADTIAHFAHTVKEATGRRKVVGAFYGYTLEFTNLAEDAGHLALGRLLESPDIDFVMSPSSYYNRNLPGTPYFRLPIASVNAHGKLFWNDFDQVSYKYYDKLKADPNLKTWEYQMGLTKTPEEFVWMIRREVGMELAMGAQLAYFDIHGGYYEDPVIMAGVAAIDRLRDEALAWPDRGSAAQILLLVDEDSEHYLSFRNPVTTQLLSAQVAVMPFVAPYDVALLSDLPTLDLRRYRMAVVLNATSVSPAMRRTFRERLCRDGRTVVWLHAAGLFRDGGRADGNMRELTGLGLRMDGDAVRVDGAAERELPGWRSVSAVTPPVDAKRLRVLALQAGVHLFTDDPRWLLFAGPHCLTVGADKDGGTAHVSLPAPRRVVDLETGETIGENVSSFEVALRAKEVRLYQLQ